MKIKEKTIGVARILTTFRGYASHSKNGTMFYPATIYNVASKNIVVVKETADGKRDVLGSKIYASPEICAKECKKLAASYIGDTREAS